MDSNTDVLPNCGMTMASTGSELSCAAVRAACRQLVQQMQPAVAKLTGGSGGVAGDGGGAYSWQQLVAACMSMFVGGSSMVRGLWKAVAGWGRL